MCMSDVLANVLADNLDVLDMKVESKLSFRTVAMTSDDVSGESEAPMVKNGKTQALNC